MLDKCPVFPFSLPKNKCTRKLKLSLNTFTLVLVQLYMR